MDSPPNPSRAARLASLARARRTREVPPELDLGHPAFKRAFDCVDAWCAPQLIKKGARKAHLLLLLGGVGNGKKRLASYAAAKLNHEDRACRPCRPCRALVFS